MTIALDHCCQSGRHTNQERGLDLYETPATAVEALLAVETLPQLIWEPAAGRGAIVRVLQAHGHDVVASDVIDYGFPLGFVTDFLLTNKAPAGCTTILTNPPFRIANKFTRHALDLAPRVYLLLRLAFLETIRRTDILERRGLARGPRLPRAAADDAPRRLGRAAGVVGNSVRLVCLAARSHRSGNPQPHLSRANNWSRLSVGARSDRCRNADQFDGVEMTQGKRMNIWTAAARQLLFEKLTEFGPYSTWASSSAPGRGRDQRYGEFFQAFAVVIGATSRAAVKHQVLFAVPIKGRAHWRAGHNRTAVLSIAAAPNAGFIAQADLPDSLVAENDADDEQPQDFPAAARPGRDPRDNEAPRAEAAGIGRD